MNHKRGAARRREDAQAGWRTYPRRQGRIEYLDENAAHILPHPLIEDGDEEVAVLFCSYRSLGHPVSFLKAGSIVPLHDWDELDELRTELVAEEAVDFEANPY